MNTWESAGRMSPKGRPEGEYRSAQREGRPLSASSNAAAVLRQAPARCIVCGESGGRSVCQKGSYELMQCRCGGMYLSPPVPDGAVDHAIDTHPDSFYALPAARKLHWLRQSHPRGRLLEVGCGNGHFLREARAAGYEVCGIELDPQRARRLAQELGVEIECAAIEEARWPAGSCDVVYHCDLLSHFPQPLLALEQMTRLLRPDGVLFFEVGIVGDLARHWYDTVPERSIPRHRWFFSEPALRRLLAQAGLKAERMKTFGLGPQAVVFKLLSRTHQRIKHVPPQLPGGGTSPADAVVPGSAIRERALEGEFNNFMRFSVGALFPRLGPLTAFVIARRNRAAQPP